MTRILTIDPKVRDIWRFYPLRIPGKSSCPKCGAPSLLVQSMSGGFVTRNCPNACSYETLPKQVFMNELDLWIACPECKCRMEAGIVPDANYGFVCTKCNVAIRLCDLLPRWEDL